MWRLTLKLVEKWQSCFHLKNPQYLQCLHGQEGIYIYIHTLIPYSSEFSRYNIFVNFVIEFTITKILFTKYLYARIVLFCRRAVAKFIFTKFSFVTISRDSQNFCAAKIWSYTVYHTMCNVLGQISFYSWLG